MVKHLFLVAFLTAAVAMAEPQKAIPRVEIVPLPGHQVSMRVDGSERVGWHFGNEYERPFFYPLKGPSGSTLTRIGHPGAPNHDHHRSIWFAHHDIEGESFWTNTSSAQIRQKHWYQYQDGVDRGLIAAQLGWFNGNGVEVMESDMIAELQNRSDGEFTFELQLNCRVPAGRNKVTLGKTNFGLLAVRVAKSLSGHFGDGTISNSERAVGEKSIFGQPARWVDYSGSVLKGNHLKRESGTEGITYFDHPDNPRYPSRWHVREDGWMGASLCMQEGLTLEPNKPLTLRYLLHVHSHRYDAGRAAQVAKAFGESPAFRIDKSPKPHEQYAVTRLAHATKLQSSNSKTASAKQDSLPAWKLQRAEILAGMQSVMGQLPEQVKRGDLDIRIESEVDAGSYLRRFLTFQSEPKCRTPAYLCIPKSVLNGKQKAPAVLCLHPTDNQVGHKVVLGMGGRAGRQYAAELAEKGFITLSPAYPQLANYWPNLGELGYASGSMKAIWDNIRALDLLSSLRQVDATNGFGVIGHSLGGHNAIFTAAFDQRISVLVSSCGFDSFADYYDGAERNWYFGKGWCQTRYMPRLSNYRGKLDTIPFDFPKLLAALAPRKVFLNAPLHDANFRWQSAAQCANEARAVFDLYKATDNLIIRHPDCDHDFPAELREEAYRVLASVLWP